MTNVEKEEEKEKPQIPQTRSPKVNAEAQRGTTGTTTKGTKNTKKDPVQLRPLPLRALRGGKLFAQLWFVPEKGEILLVSSTDRVCHEPNR